MILIGWMSESFFDATYTPQYFFNPGWLPATFFSGAESTGVFSQVNDNRRNAASGTITKHLTLFRGEVCAFAIIWILRVIFLSANPVAKLKAVVSDAKFNNKPAYTFLFSP